MAEALSDSALETLFLKARTHNGWQDRPVPEDLLRRLWDLARMGPTAANSLPVRVVFVTTPAGKERLRPALSEGNVAKTMAAPVTAIIGHDLAFYEHLPRLFPHTDARSWFVGNEAAILDTARLNGSLQGAYLILAARALGLDCGPMGGFDRDKVNAAFFPEGTIRANFLCNIGYGDPAALHPRNPRLEFDEACTIA